MGRVVDPLGNPIDGKGPIEASLTDVVEKVAPGVIARQSVDQPVQTGLKAIDTMVPVGRGQRERHAGTRARTSRQGVLNLCLYGRRIGSRRLRWTPGKLEDELAVAR